MTVAATSFFVLFCAVSGTIISASPTDYEKFLRQLPDEIQDEFNLTTPEIITKHNYPAETHEVTTEDGYILTLHRIPNPASSTKGSILVMHGILASSADWVITGPENGLGYILANEGYDVWLGNGRGNTYSRNHTSLDPESKEFWDFSWHQIGYYDLPVMIDYIIETTGEKQIFHIGHSQGTTTFYVMCSERPEYNVKIRAHFSLAPVAYVNHITSPLLQVLARAKGLLKEVAQILNINELMPKGGLVSLLGSHFCGINDVTADLCENVLFAICGADHKQLNTTILPLILAHVPAGSSVNQVLHYAQEITSGAFRQFDFGILGNWKKYKSFTPPNYDLTKIKAPIYLLFSRNDWISSMRDVQKLATELKDVRGKFLVSDNNFNHLDYLFGMDAPKVVYEKIISLLTRH